MRITVAKKGTAAARAGEYIGRGSPLGNPLRLKGVGGTYTREESVAAYEAYLRERIARRDPGIAAELHRLRSILHDTGSVTLVCFCAPLACHGDVVKKILLEQQT
jgi:hypothetical protein